MDATHRSLLLAAHVTAAVAAAGCIGHIGDRDEGDADGRVGGAPMPSADLVGVAGLRRLSVHEYDRTVRDLLGDDTRPAASYLPEDPRTPFDNDVATQTVSAALVDGAEALAIDVAARLIADPARRDAVVGCIPSGPEDAECALAFVRDFGRRALRRPLDDGEIASYTALFGFAAETGDFYVGVETALWALLQDPEFLYRVEIGRPASDGSGLVRLDNFELMTRLSYLLWGSTPDDRLLDAALDAEAAGRDLAPDEIRALASEMLADSRAAEQLYRFHALWLGFETLPHEPELAADMRLETAALLERVIFEEAGAWNDIFLADETFLTASLAAHYALPAPDAPQGGWVPYGASGRKGLLSHGTFLVNGGKFEDTSPVFRGLAVRQRLLCQTIPPPPANVNVDDALMTDSPCKWEKYLPTLQDGCVGCHAEFNPAGWGLEEYDSQGRFRTVDAAGCEIAEHANGEVPGLGTFRGPGALGALVAPSEELLQCLGTQLIRFAVGRGEPSAEDQALRAALLADRDGSLRFDELLLELVSSPAFAFRKLEE
jgi:hypothetical protein